MKNKYGCFDSVLLFIIILANLHNVQIRFSFIKLFGITENARL